MWDWLVYAALALATVAVGASLALVAVRALQAWRSFKRLRRHVSRALDEVAEKMEAMHDTMASASDTAELVASLARLRRSLAKLALLREAWSEATRFTALVPRK